MKKPTNLLALGIAAWLLNLGVLPAQADLEVSASVQIHSSADFYAPLASCGSWVVVGSYGRCWRPAGVVVNWQPYCDGYWVWTDCGWYWVSDDPWAWACYHYGYWVYDSIYGWIWVPGVEWAPAWVCWRYGGGYIGWAPIAPPGTFFAHRPADSAFVFVDNDHFGSRITSASVIVNNPAVIRRTTFVSNTQHVTRNLGGVGPRKVIINEGPGLAVMEKNTGRKFTTVSVMDADRRTPLPSNFRHPAVSTEVNHEHKTMVPPDNNPPGPNGKGNGNTVPTGKHRPDHNKVPNRPTDASPDSGGDPEGGHGHGHDHD
jgi:hypothetical protein